MGYHTKSTTDKPAKKPVKKPVMSSRYLTHLYHYHEVNKLKNM